MSFDEVYDRNHASLYRYLHRYTGDADVADDLAQEAFVRLLRSNVPDDEARPWLFRVATNLARDRHRRSKRRGRLLRGWLSGRDEPHQPPDPAERADTVARVRAALEGLDERDRRMLLMREEGFAYREIAQAVGVATGSVGTLLARALKRFRSEYDGD